MSAIAGLVDVRGGPVDADLVARMIEASRAPGLDVSGPVRRSSAALAVCGRRTRGAGSNPPLVDARADCAIVFDGRLDNRGDLARWLDVDEARSDAALVLAGYTTRGLASVARLFGDFAFAIWDGGARRLVLARDPLGVRQV